MRHDIINIESAPGHVIVIFILTFLAYSNTFNGEFVFDDTKYIVENPIIRDFKYFVDSSLVQNTTFSNDIFDNKYIKYSYRVRRAAFFTFALNYNIHGLNVAGYHAVNFYIHVFNALLVYWLILLLFETQLFVDSRNGNINYGLSKHSIAFSVALLYAVHPVQTETVSYISQRFTSLVAFFYFLSAIAYIKSRICPISAKGYAYYYGSIVAAVFAVITKENAATLPFALTLIEIIFFSPLLKQKLTKTILRLLPFYLIITVIPIQIKGSKLFLLTFDKALNVVNPKNIPVSHYLYTQFYALVVYLRLLIIPVNQNADYLQAVFTTILNYKVIGSLLILISILLFSVYLCFVKTKASEDRFYFRVAAFGIFWYFITIFVESSFFVLNDALVEHRVYLPSFGFFVTVVFLFAVVKSRYPNAITNNNYMLLLILTAMTLTIVAYNRNKVWSNCLTFAEDIINKSPHNYRFHTDIAASYIKIGSYNKAVDELNESIKIRPSYLKSYLELKKVFVAQGKDDYAIKALQNVFRYNFKHFEAHNGLAFLYTKNRQFDKALSEYRFLLRYHGTNAVVHNSYGNYFFVQKHFNEAATQYKRALLLNPTYSLARQNLDTTLNLIAEQGSR